MNQKKMVRQRFRDAVFARDKNRCAICGWTRSPQQINDLDAHHITDRHKMPNGGYVVENGISLCPDCHLKAEQFHSTGVAVPGYSIDELYARISSSYEKAFQASERLS